MKRNSIFFDHEQRKRELRRISMIGPKISFTPKKKETIKIPKEIINEISQEKKKKIRDLRFQELKIIKKSLDKHSININDKYNKQVIQNILNKNSCQHGRFKEMLLMIENVEFLKKSYGYYKSKDRIKLFGFLFNLNNKIYPSYLGMGFSIYNFMTHYLLIKQKLIDRIINKGKSNNIKKTSQTNSFSLSFYLDYSVKENYNKSKDSESFEKIVENNEQENVKDISIKEITKLIYNIISCEETIKKEKEKKKINFINKESSDLSEIPILFKSPPPLRNKKKNLNYPKIKNPSQSAGRIKKHILKSYIKHYQEKNLDNLNINVSISKDDKKKISELYLSKSKKDYDLNKLKNNPDLYINDKHFIPKSKTERSKFFKTTKDFLVNSKKNNKNDFQNVINNLIKNPLEFFQSIEDYKNKKKTKHKRNLTNILNNNQTQTPFFLRTYSKNNHSKYILKSECFNIDEQNSPKIINKKNKKKYNILNIKQSRNKNLNISSNYYYNSFFNNENKTIEKQTLKLENINSCSSLKNNFPIVLSTINKDTYSNNSDKSIFKKKITNKSKNHFHFKRNYSSYNYKAKKKNFEHKEKYDNIYLRNISN